MNDASDGKPFHVYSIDVTYSYNTEAPTFSPTNAPTLPSASPTRSPTRSPNGRPTTSPSSNLIILPTERTTLSTSDAEQVEEDQSVISTSITPTDSQTSPLHLEAINLVSFSIIGVLLCLVGLLLLLVYKKKTKSAEESSHHDLIAPTPNDDGSDDDGSLPEMEGENDKNNGNYINL